MRIGIITFHSAPNHGAALQAYALEYYLRQIGHDVFFINYNLGGGYPQKGIYRWLSRTPMGIIEKINQQNRIKPFVLFQNEFLSVGDKYYSDYMCLNDDPPYADVYICGSDQIWNPMFIRKRDDERVYWLDFISDKKRCIAYAASIGVDSLDGDVMLRYACYAKKMHSISVREKDSVMLVKSLGVEDVYLVPDPTLLIDVSGYRDIEEKKKMKQGEYLFDYVLGSDNDNLATIVRETIIKLLHCSLYVSYRKSLLSNIIYKGYIGPGEWLSGIRQSCCVLTNSFHATVFSIIYHKVFVVILRDGESVGMNNRIASLLGMVGLQHRCIKSYDKGYIEHLCLEEIDWESVDERLREFRELGVMFIDNALC